ncbi:unnamed protein product, partial [Symbiodinium pilosum]
TPADFGWLVAINLGTRDTCGMMFGTSTQRTLSSAGRRFTMDQAQHHLTVAKQQ